MPSSISSSEFVYARLTASDRPGVAQPVPQRDIPARPWPAALLAALLLAAALVAAWEFHWRAYGVEPAIKNSNGLWAQQRRRIDSGEGGKLVLAGSSRLLFDVDLDTLERQSGERPIQLALEGTSPLFVLEDLAADPKFTGRLLVGVAPELFFGGRGYRAGAIPYFRKESPSQRVGQWLSMHLLEPWLAFDDPDYALSTVVQRQPWPLRPGYERRLRVRRLAVSEADRNTHLWRKVEDDPAYAALARRIWAQDFAPTEGAKKAEQEQVIDRELGRATKVVAQLRARGIEVVFVRPPSEGEYLAYEEREFPRARTWDRLLEQTGAPGIHFADHPELQGYRLPEWSHLAAAERPRFTEALQKLVAAPHTPPP